MRRLELGKVQKKIKEVVEMGLTEKQKRFVDEYLIDLNATQAAIRAGYSGKTAYSTGNENLKKPEIKKAIEEALAAVHSAKIADAEEILEYLTAVIRGESKSSVVVVESIGDYMSEARVLEKPPDEKERLKAAELLGKRYSMWTDKVDVTSDGIVQIIDDIPKGDTGD